MRKDFALKMTHEELVEALEQRSRRPFRALLARVLEQAPSEQAIRSLAEKNPDRYGQLLALVGRLGGYTEKLEVEGSFALTIQSLSDAQLQQAILGMQEQLDTPSSESTGK